MIQDDETKLALYASTLSATEIGLGGLLHSLHLPGTGQVLSLNQIALLSHASHSIESKTAPTVISTISALLKSLTPIGKKLTPMLAIAMQGLLFNVGILFFGNSFFGRAAGALLSSIWSFIQPALFYTLIFGFDIWSILEKMSAKLFPEGTLLWVITLAVAVKMTLAVMISLFAHKLPLSFFARFKATFPRQKTVSRSAWISAFYDLLRPTFLASLGLIALFFYFAHSPPEWILFGLFRPIACGYLLFVLLRLSPMEKCLNLFQSDSWFKKVVTRTLHHLSAAKK